MSVNLKAISLILIYHLIIIWQKELYLTIRLLNIYKHTLIIAM